MLLEDLLRVNNRMMDLMLNQVGFGWVLWLKMGKAHLVTQGKKASQGVVRIKTTEQQVCSREHWPTLKNVI